MTNLTLVLHVLLCIALFYSCFCRLVRTDDTTHVAVRFAFWMLAVVSIVCGLSPFTGWMKPSWPELGLLTGTVATQLVTAFYWHPGVPPHFVRTHAALVPKGRTRCGGTST